MKSRKGFLKQFRLNALLMKSRYLLFVFLFLACNNKPANQQAGTMPEDPADAVKVEVPRPDTPNNRVDATINPRDTQLPQPGQPKLYSNFRFKDVRVEKSGEHRFTIRGKGQIFEATFGWVVEDGHNELLKGYAMIDAGPPEWGNFEFTVEVKKQRPNSTLMLILYESSAKDGSRQYELPVLLE